MSLKDSGIEWISYIPIDWEVKKLKYLSEIIDGDRGSEYPNDKDLVDKGILFLSGDNLKPNGFDYSKVRFISEEKFSKLGRGKVMKNDIITSVRGTIGSAGLFGGEIYEQAFINAQMMIIRPRKMLYSKFLFYFTKTKAWKLCLNYFAYGTAQQQLSNKILMQLPIAIPNLKIQYRIVKYLDDKISKVDEFIEKKEQLISMLDQLRQSIITEAVTKGLNPNVKMKDSGVEWIGEIPEHWGIKKIKNIANVYSSNVDKKSVEGEKEVLLCNYVDVYYNDSITADKNFMKATAKDEQIKTFTLKKHDVIITKDSESPKDIAIPTWVSEDLDGVVCGYHLSLIRCFENTLGHYLYYTLESNQIKEQFYTKANGVTRFGLSKEAIKNGLIAIPPFNEQLEIAEMLNNVNQEVRSTVEKLKIQIEKLKEYRQALIYEAVTGKIDVRDMELDEVR
ncbi:restriction endonuclease subunit S [Bacillus altitudinis]|uniref:restriction endonuclease subunit S n=1 Tax=Bacillus altitudinis TaxID=293387 RepID=UPI0037CA2A4F